MKENSLIKKTHKLGENSLKKSLKIEGNPLKIFQSLESPLIGFSFWKIQRPRN